MEERPSVGSFSGTRVSVVVMKEAEIGRFPALQRRFDEGDRIACFNAGDFEFGACLVDGHVVCAIGDLPPQEIKSLLASVETR